MVHWVRNVQARMCAMQILSAVQNAPVDGASDSDSV